VAISLAVLSTACGGIRIGDVLENADRGGTTRVQVGREAVLLVPAPDRVGWRWIVQKHDSAHLLLAGRQAASSIKELSKAGIDTERREALRFKVAAKGTTTLVLVYCRVADCEATVEKTATCRIEGVK
jgi:predicted secreted protein